MKRSRRTSIAMCDDLHKASALRGKKLGYSSYGNYLHGLILADLITRPGHGLPLKVLKMGRSTQEKIIASLLAQEETALDILQEAEEARDVVLMAAGYKDQREASLKPSGKPKGEEAA